MKKGLKLLLIISCAIFLTGIAYASQTIEPIIVIKDNPYYHIYKLVDSYTNDKINEDKVKLDKEIESLEDEKKFYEEDFYTDCINVCPSDCELDYNYLQFNNIKECKAQCNDWCKAEKETRLFETDEKIKSKLKEKDELENIK